jgi:hypothetical protein
MTTTPLKSNVGNVVEIILLMMTCNSRLGIASSMSMISGERCIPA